MSRCFFVLFDNWSIKLGMLPEIWSFASLFLILKHFWPLFVSDSDLFIEELFFVFCNDFLEKQVFKSDF